MKLKQEFVLREVAGDYLLIPVVGEGDQFQGVITLNETGAFIWKQLEAEKDAEEIVAAMLEEYEVDQKKAEKDVADLCDKLRHLGIL